MPAVISECRKYPNYPYIWMDPKRLFYYPKLRGVEVQFANVWHFKWGWTRQIFLMFSLISLREKIEINQIVTTLTFEPKIRILAFMMVMSIDSIYYAM